MNCKNSFLITFIIITTIICLLPACNKKPTEPEYDNPFDILENPNDPLQLTAHIAYGGVHLSWIMPGFEGLKSFKIYRSEQPTSGFSELSTVQSKQVHYIDGTIKNGHSYWYLVTAINDENIESSRTNIASVKINTAPVLIINGSDGYAPSRNVELTILANTATQMILSENSDFIGADWESYATSKAWILPTGEGLKTVYMKVKFDSVESPVVSATATPQPINPAIAILSDTTQYTSTRMVPLTLSAQGDNLQMKISDDSTFTGLDWQTFSSSENFTLSPGDGQKTVYMKVKNDFGMVSSLAFDNIFPQPISATITIANGAQYANTRTVALTLSAEGDNLQMKISDDSTFIGLDWQTFSSSENFTLSTGDGEKTVYAKIKNDFEIESNNIWDTIILDTTPPSIALTVSPDSGITFETNFKFDPSASRDNLAPLQDMQIRFDYDNNGTFDTEWQVASIINYQYTIGGGDKIVKMWLKDGAGNQADTTVTVFVNTRPKPSFKATVAENDSCTWKFDASASYDYEDGVNIEYRWDFDGDGNWETKWLKQDTISYTYTSYGNYTVKLNVRDQYKLTSENELYVDIFYYSTVTDIDGNVYKTVKIGNQWWMVENLKVTHFRNGDAIPNIADTTDWEYISRAAYCIYKNNNSFVHKYGLLYNWNSVDDSRNIAPEGWHIPTNGEWWTLVNVLGGESVAGDKLKAKSGWYTNSGTNRSGFAALPGGLRNKDEFYNLGYRGYWWTSTDNESSHYVPYWSLSYDNSVAKENYGSRHGGGLSVRCIKD